MVGSGGSGCCRGIVGGSNRRIFAAEFVVDGDGDDGDEDEGEDDDHCAGSGSTPIIPMIRTQLKLSNEQAFRPYWLSGPVPRAVQLAITSEKFQPAPLVGAFDWDINVEYLVLVTHPRGKFFSLDSLEIFLDF